MMNQCYVRLSFDHEHDVQTFEECDDFLLGRDILVASVVEQGERQRRAMAAG